MPSRPEAARLFFALWPDPAVRRALARVQARLDLPGRAVAATQLHITLAFLGGVALEHLPALSALGGRVSLPAGTLELDQVGCFPRAEVAWVGPARPTPSLLAFQRDLNARLAAGGFRSERRRWAPHVTLYRNLRTPCGNMTIEPVPWRLDGHCLVQSELGQDGPRYRVLQRWPVAG